MPNFAVLNNDAILAAPIPQHVPPRQLHVAKLTLSTAPQMPLSTYFHMKHFPLQALLLSLLALFASVAAGTSAEAQPLSLDSCRVLALQNNKALSIRLAERDKAHYTHRAARTNYLPKLSATAAYVHTGEEISLLSDKQKQQLQNLGTMTAEGAAATVQQILAQHPELASLIQPLASNLGTAATTLNAVGGELVQALHTNTRDVGLAALVLSQPLYMGGKIRAYDRITGYATELADERYRAETHDVILEVDKAYWQVVSLVHKQRLTLAYRDMLRHLDSDILKMIGQGVATRANELTVSVKLNEADMMLTKVENGLVLSRMLLNQLCGRPLDEPIITSDEQLDELATVASDVTPGLETAFDCRPELRQLTLATRIYDERVRVERAAALPQLALMGAVYTNNPALTNGFENRFRTNWSVGVTFRMPLWNWGETRFKVRAAKAESQVAQLQLEEAQEKIQLQVTQSAQQVNEANKQFAMSLKNMEKANENLRTADLGFREGVIATSDLLAAQTAWLQAQSDKIDSEIGIRIARATLRKAQGL